MIEIITKENQRTSIWSGGTTTELIISPRDSEYSKRNFDWRISSAIVELEESDFTALPLVDRHIMIIEGELDLEHEGHYSVHLSPYQKDFFKGDWITKSKGKVRDFNLMLKNGYSGDIEGARIDKKLELECKKGYTYALYCTNGRVDFELENGDYTLEEGDIAIINTKTCQLIVQNKVPNPSMLIITNIYN